MATSVCLSHSANGGSRVLRNYGPSHPRILHSWYLPPSHMTDFFTKRLKSLVSWRVLAHLTKWSKNFYESCLCCGCSKCFIRAVFYLLKNMRRKISHQSLERNLLEPAWSISYRHPHTVFISGYTSTVLLPTPRTFHVSRLKFCRHLISVMRATRLIHPIFLYFTP